MMASSHGRRAVYAVLPGIAIGAVVTVILLATATQPAVYYWPSASQVETTSVTFAGRGVGLFGTGGLPSDCTTMLVDLDSTLPVVLWVIPHSESVATNGTPTIASYYYWSGETPVSHVSSVATVTDPANGIDFVVFDPANLTGTASAGAAFSASDCPLE